MKSRSGFTIVELLIVIVVIAILAAISTIAYRGIRERADYATMVSSVDGWEKILKMIKAQDGEYPLTEGEGAPIGAYVCLTNRETLPATSLFDENVCYSALISGTYQPVALTLNPSGNLAQKLQQQASALPSTPLAEHSYSTVRVRGIMYANAPGIASPRISYVYRENYGCPRGHLATTTDTQGRTLTICTVLLN